MTTGTTKLQGSPTLTRALHKSERKLYVEMTFAIVKGAAEGEVLGSVAVARNVTDRVERESALRPARLETVEVLAHFSPSETILCSHIRERPPCQAFSTIGRRSRLGLHPFVKTLSNVIKCDGPVMQTMVKK
jgi:hypothetical protein